MDVQTGVQVLGVSGVPQSGVGPTQMRNDGIDVLITGTTRKNDPGASALPVRRGCATGLAASAILAGVRRLAVPALRPVELTLRC